MADGLPKTKLPSGEELVLHSKTEPSCKICSHPHRLTIDKLLIARSQRQSDDQGRPINQEYIQEVAEKEWQLYLSPENISTHFKRHVRYLDAVERMRTKVSRLADQEMRAAAVAHVAEELQITDLLTSILAYGKKNLEDTDGTSVGVDQMLKAIDLKLKMTAAPAVNELNAAAAKALKLKNAKTEAAMAPVVDVEVLEDE